MLVRAALALLGLSPGMPPCPQLQKKDGASRDEGDECEQLFVAKVHRIFS
jgi:hypothetical protein